MFAGTIVCGLLWLLPAGGWSVSVPLIQTGSAWRYLDDGPEPDSGWKDPGYNDAAWLTGPGELGFGDGDEAWTVRYGGDPGNKRITTWFRRTFHVADAIQVSPLHLDLLRDDGAIVYLNGTEICRSNMPSGEVTSATLALTAVGGTDESTYFSCSVPAGFLVDGPNVLAVEIHQCSPTSSDLGFDLGLAADAMATLVHPGAEWRYLDDGSDQGTAWHATSFDDSSWSTGPAELGYGDGDEGTVVGYGPDPANKYITTYFRRAFDVGSTAGLTRLQLRLLRDDGAVVYLNGSEVARSNMPDGTVGHTTRASAGVSGGDESTWHSFSLSPSLLLTGTNTVAVEIHQSWPNSTDISFDLELVASGEGSMVTRGPYLQLATSSTMTVRWNSDTEYTGRVAYGTSADHVTSTKDETASSMAHSVQLTSLTPNTRYYYVVGSTSSTVTSRAGAGSFSTLPPPGENRAVRIWQLSDFGRGNTAQRQVYNAFRSATATDPPGLWITTWDNAQIVGADSEYQSYLFDFYPEMVAALPVFTAYGNHDSYSSDSGTQTGPYYDNFTQPRAGEAGGIPSGTKAYYSFDYGQIHFVCLDTPEGDLTTTGAMMTWLLNDLAANTRDWLIAYWHYPPYTKGTHDSDSLSDSGGRMTTIRENFLPVLEANGVDLVLNGHSHVFERSFLLDGHYGLSTSFTAAMKKDPGDGRVDGTGPYAKPSRGPAPNEGTVYAVSAIGGALGSGPLNHPAMFMSTSTLGFMLIDVDGNRLDARAIRENGSVIDYFTIVKDTATTPVVESVTRLDASPTSASTVRFHVLFNHSVSGVDEADFLANATEVSGADIESVLGSGTSWTVSVNTGSGDGELGLRVTDDDSIVNGVTAPLGGVGPGNGDHDSTQVYRIDRTPPIATFTRLTPNPTNRDSVSYDVSFSETVSPSFDVSQVSAIGTLAAGAAIGMSGTDADFEITVAMTDPDADGTIGIQLGDGIRDEAGNGFVPVSSPLYTIDQAVPVHCSTLEIE